MTESRRLQGLQTLRSFGLPTPNWQEVRSVTDIDTLRISVTSRGWTIRTCRTDGQREVGGFFKNHVEAAEVASTLRTRSQKFDQGEFYLVYPSWEFDMSFNVVFDESIFLVEGKRGSQKGISDGTELPEIALRLSSTALSRPEVLIGEYTPAVRSRVSRILSHLKKVPTERYYTEVAVTTERQLFFYEFFPVADQVDVGPAQR